VILTRQATTVAHLPEQTANIGQIGFDLANAAYAQLAPLAVQRYSRLACRTAWTSRVAPGLVQQRRLAELLPPLGRQALPLHPILASDQHALGVFRWQHF
jgi:hypothetical protein